MTLVHNNGLRIQIRTLALCRVHRSRTIDLVVGERWLMERLLAIVLYSRVVGPAFWQNTNRSAGPSEIHSGMMRSAAGQSADTRPRHETDSAADWLQIRPGIAATGFR